MKTVAILLTGLVLLGVSCGKQEEKKPLSGRLAKRLDLMDHARETRRKQNQAIERENKLLEEMAEKVRRQTSTE